MWMIAIKEHGYAGRRVKIGQEYEVLSQRDRVVLQVAGLSKPKSVVTAVVPPKIEKRDSLPEGEERDLVVEENSPPEGRKRRKRRHYNRKDMTPDSE